MLRFYLLRFKFVPSTIINFYWLSSFKSVLRINKESINLDTCLPVKEDEYSLISIPVYKVYTEIQEKSTLSMIK